MIVLDSDVLVDFLRGQEQAVSFVQFLLHRGEEVATTTVNLAELRRGAEASSRSRASLADLEALLEPLDLLPLDGEAAKRYGYEQARLDHQGTPAPVLNMLIASITLEHGGGRIATRNARDFRRVPGLEITGPS